jgi:hypothetical protein
MYFCLTLCSILLAVSYARAASQTRICGCLRETAMVCKSYKETVEKTVSGRLMENVHMQGFRNPEE